MQKYDVHFCLVSDQAAPNLLPILDSSFKPQRIILITTKRMKQKAEFLSETVKKKNVISIIEELSDEFNFSSIENELFNLTEKYIDDDIALNVTGATKLISIAAGHAFSAAGKPIFYVDTDEKRIIFISKDENGEWIPDRKLESVTSLDIYLSSYGAKILENSTNIVEGRKDNLSFVEPWIKKYTEYESDISKLNGLALKAENNKNNKALRTDVKPSDKLDEMLKGLSYLNQIDYDNKTVDFYDTENRGFFGGKWLEDYVYQKIKDLNAIDDIACGLLVSNSFYNENKHSNNIKNQGNNNDFDIVFMANNKLHIIECKTSKMHKNGNEDNNIKADDILYKLETLKDYGGFMTKKCLVTYYPVKESIINRAKFYKIEIIQAEQIARVRDHIANWIGKR